MSAADCRTIDGINHAQLAAMDQLNQKMNGLQRLGELLSAAANPAGLMPDINTLVPLRDLNLDAIQSLASNCPFIFPGGVGYDPLEDIRNQLLVSYRSMFDALNNHPWSRLGKLQGKLNRFQAQFTHLSLDRISGFIRCAAAVCDATQQLPGDILRQGQVIDAYRTNFITNGGQVLTAPMQLKSRQVDLLKARVADLGAPS